MRRMSLLVVALVVLACTGCIGLPGDTSKIGLASSTTANGWRYDYYRNRAYPCSISGYQTFVVGTRVGSSPTAAAPLLVWMHGGGVGWFDANGTPQPDTAQMTEQSASTLQATLTNPGLLTSIRNDAAGFRVLAVSYCNRDVYSGDTTTVDPHNPNRNADGSAKTTNGLLATKAAVAFVQHLYPTSKYVLAGGSAGSAGAYEVGWSEEVSNNAPAGVIGDASVLNLEQGVAAYAQGVCRNSAFAGGASLIRQRFAPEIADVDNEPDKLVARGALTVPLLHIWNHGDTNTCGNTLMQCPMRDGSTATMGATDCVHEPLRAAIAAQGPASRSKNLPVCVDDDGTPNCSLHVVTTHAGLTNTDPASPADYVGAVVAWVDARLADGS